MKRVNLLSVKKYWLIISIVFLSLFLRLYRISSYMTFLGDEGRDALVWLHMLHGKYTLIGPTTSIGNMYLGPLYYYLMLPFYLIFGAVGPSVGVALFAGATTFLLWKFGKEWFSEKVGLLAALLYAISPVAITLSRSSWNPNVMPFFSLLTVWGIWQFWQKDKFYWLPIIGILLSFATQSHYLGALLIPVVGLFFVVKLISLVKEKSENTNKFLVNFALYRLVRGFALCTLSFALLTVLPLVWFDLRHNFINFHSFQKFFSERQTTVNLKPYKAIPQIWPLWQMLVERLVTATNYFLGFWTAIILFFSFLWRLVRESKSKKGLLLISAWVFIGLLGMGLYKQHVYDHYFGFLFPAIFLITAIVLEEIFNKRKNGRLVFWGLFGLLVILNLRDSPLLKSPNFQLERTYLVDKAILKEAKGKSFNLGMIAKQNYDAGYRYFLELWEEKAVEIDALRSDQTITDQLFVVCEESECQPVGHPQAEIANFGWSQVEDKWEFPWGVKLFKLVHYK